MADMFGDFSDFRIFGILGFESIFLPADRGDHSQYPGEAFERLGHSSGAQSWPDFSSFISARWSDFGPALLRVNRIYILRAETMVDGLPGAFRFMVRMVVGLLVGL